MGVVYRAFDVEVPREVALKTIRETHDSAALELFRRECSVLAKLQHPNIVDLYDFGDFEEDGQTRPYFVMPLLPGVTFDKIIRNSTTRLSVERVIEIISHVCRGLQAAHDRGLVHRDIKPSNIFVLEDDSVKLIDFGVAHLVGNRTTSGVKGTLSYMSPEQIQMAQPSATSDIFSLAVVCYEALTQRKPFTGTRESEVARAILQDIPLPASDFNPAVSLALSQVIQAAMAKKAIHRTASARQFAEELQKALRKQPIDRFEPAKIEPRLRRVQKALGDSEYEFAGEILSELEAEGHIRPEIRSLRQQVDRAIRQNTIRQIIESARRRLQDEEYALALQKVEEVLKIDPANEEGRELRAAITTKHTSQQIESGFLQAEQHLANHDYGNARAALQNVLKISATETRALQLVADIDRREEDYLTAKKEKEEIYHLALDCWHRGEVTSALTKLERVLELDRQAPENVAQDTPGPYQSLYNEVRSEQEAIENAHARARQLISAGDRAAARALCEQYLRKYPGHALFQALAFDISEHERLHVAACVAQVDRDVESEPDLDRKIAILNTALSQYPHQAHLQETLKAASDRRDLVNSIVQKARNLEDRGQYTDALNQWEMLRTIYGQYPRLDYERDRVIRQRDQQSRSDARTRGLEQIDRFLSVGDYGRALSVLQKASAEFGNDPEFTRLESLVNDGLTRSAQAAEIFEKGQDLCAQGELESGLQSLRRAHELAPHSSLIRAVLVENLLKHAATKLDADPEQAGEMVRHALELDPSNAQARTIQARLLSRKPALSEPATEARRPSEKSAGAQAVPKAPPESRPEPPTVPMPAPALRKAEPGIESEAETAGWSATRIGTVPKAVSISQSPVSAVRKEDSGAGNQEVEAQPPAEEQVPPKSRSMALVAALIVIAAVLVIGGVVVLRRGHVAAPSSSTGFEAEFDVTASVPGAHILVNNQDKGSSPAHLKLPEGQYDIDAVLAGYKSAGSVKVVISPSTVNGPIDISLTPLSGEIAAAAPPSVEDASKSSAEGTGWLRLNVSPRGTNITWQRNGGTQTVGVKSGERVSLPVGQYLITATAEKYRSRRGMVTIIAGVEFPLDWTLDKSDEDRTAAPAAPAARAIGMEGLDGQFSKEDNGWYLAKSKVSLFSTKVPGNFFFNIRLTGRRKRAVWIANYENDRKYVQFEIDERAITPSITVDGRTTTDKPTTHQLKKTDDYYTLSIYVASDRIVFSGFKDGNYVPFFTWTSQAANLLEGKFGFRDEVSLNGFRFDEFK